MKCKIYLKNFLALFTVTMLSVTMALAQAVNVQGTVTGNSGEALIGVSVLVKGTNKDTD